MFVQEEEILLHLIKKALLIPKAIIVLVKVVQAHTAMVNFIQEVLKRGNINRILNTFVQFGAEDKILYESHPHIGTNKLPHIITAMREKIIECGGEVLFEKKVVDFILTNDIIKAVATEDGNIFNGDAVILATGHSARDIFQLLHNKKILIEAKPFALGVRIEHPQTLIDSIQYHCAVRGDYLPPASYGLVEQVNERGVFSFCMCPGGIIAPAATNPR